MVLGTRVGVRHFMTSRAVWPVQFDAPYGHALIAKYAMATRRHMYEYGTTIEQLAEIAVSTRYNASLNPDAYYRYPITIDEVNAIAEEAGVWVTAGAAGGKAP